MTMTSDDDLNDEPNGQGAPAADTEDLQLIAVDHEISPSQLRNLERATGITVLDRTGVIIEIFHRHAHSREARMQVEIARLRYESPRVRESPRGKERQAGRGSGEAGLELDRRKIRDRIAELKEQLEALQKEYSVRRAQRREARRVALVGYTNAGKSSLMRALTGSDVYVENKLFATLDTTVRALTPEVEPRILISDTVGFIKKLPHDLVASFKSTLDEASEASLLLARRRRIGPELAGAAGRDARSADRDRRAPGAKSAAHEQGGLPDGRSAARAARRAARGLVLVRQAPRGRRGSPAEDHRLLRVELRARRGARALQ